MYYHSDTLVNFLQTRMQNFPNKMILQLWQDNTDFTDHTVLTYNLQTGPQTTPMDPKMVYK